MLPIISRIELRNGINFRVTTDKIVGCSFTVETCDVEINDATDFHRRLVQVLRQIHPSIVCRIELHSEDAHDLSDEGGRP